MSTLTRAGVIATLAALGLSAGCGTNTPSARTSAKALSWAAVSSGLRPTVERSSPNPCQRGVPACLDILAAEMVRRARALATRCDHDAPFAAVYRQITDAIRAALSAGRFGNPARMTLFSAVFARMYTQAFDAWRAGHHPAVPAAWQVAFAAADERAVSSLGDLLLGMNAHITHDLPSVVAEVMRGPATPVNPDYALVSQIIAEISQAALRETGAHLDPSLSLAQIPIAVGPAGSFGVLIDQWRTESWGNGIALRDAGTTGRPAVAGQIDRSATLRATLIEGATAYVPLVDDSTARDAYCAAHHGVWP